MEQVIVNLLENALKYTPERTPIHISVWIDANRMGVRVSDKGPGIPLEDFNHLFEKFYRGAQSVKKGGAGLGLAICKGIVQIHGGTIRAANQTTGGAVFEFYLPLNHPGREGF